MEGKNGDGPAPPLRIKPKELKNDERDRRDAEPQIGGGFRLIDGEEGLCAAAARRSKTDYIYIYIAFDIDDAAGLALGTGIFRQEGENMVVYGNCHLWSPADDGRALVVPTGGGDYAGYFAFHPGRPLKLVETPLPSDLGAGVRRANTRMQRLLASDALGQVQRKSYVHRIRNEDREIFCDTARVAA